MRHVVVNAVGEQCPIPVVKANRALQELREPGVLEVRVDNESAAQNLLRMAAGHQLPAEMERRADGVLAVTIQVAEPVGDLPAETAVPACAPANGGGLVVAVDTEIMGRGSDELGRVLMKGFLFALGQLPRLPETVLFYNGGARLTVEGSDSLEDLRALESRGVELLTCGTCLDFYGLKEHLAVGGVTNMYAIAEKLAGAGRVVKP